MNRRLHIAPQTKTVLLKQNEADGQVSDGVLVIPHRYIFQYGGSPKERGDRKNQYIVISMKISDRQEVV